MAKQSVFMFENHGNTFWANKSSPSDTQNVTNGAKSAFITKLTSTELDFQQGTEKTVLKGTFEIGLLSGSPATIWDLISNTNFLNSSLVSSWLYTDPTVNGIRYYSYAAPVSISDFSQL